MDIKKARKRAEAAAGSTTVGDDGLDDWVSEAVLRAARDRDRDAGGGEESD